MKVAMRRSFPRAPTLTRTVLAFRGQRHRSTLASNSINDALLVDTSNVRESSSDKLRPHTCEESATDVQFLLHLFL